MSIWGKLGLVSESTQESLPNEFLEKEKIGEIKQTEIKQTEKIETIQKSTISFAIPSITAPSFKQIVGKIDDSILEKLSIAIEDKNIAGNDFIEFMQSLNKMSNLAVDDKNKFNMVFAILATSSGGMSKEHLVKSVDYYINVLANEKNTFNNEMLNATEEMVSKKELYSKQLMDSVQLKTQEITNLSKEIEELKAESVKCNDDVSSSKIAIAQKQADFNITSQHLINQIVDYKQKIEQYIQ